MKTQTSLLQILLIIMVSEISFAQITFQRTYGIIGNDEGVIVKQIHDSNYIVAGYVGGAFLADETFRNLPYRNNTYIGSGKVFLMETNSYGDTLWTKTYGGNSIDLGNSMTPTFDGGYAVVGSSQSYGAGASDVFLIRTDSNGNITWARTYGGLFYESGFSISQTSDLGFIIAGSAPDSVNTNSDFYLIKTDLNGDTLWTKSFGGAGNDAARSIIQTSDGGYIVCGETESFGVDSLDIFVSKINSNGDTMWSKTYGGNGNDYAVSIIQAKDAGYLISGGTSSYGAGGFDEYLIKTDSVGSIIWNRTYGGIYNDFSNAIRFTNDGGYIIAGIANYFYNGAFNSNAHLIKINSTGDTLWTKTFNANNDSRASSVDLTSDGGYIVSGSTTPVGLWPDIYLNKTDSLGNSLCNQTNSVTTVGNPNTQVLSSTPIIYSVSTVTAPIPVTGAGISVNSICVPQSLTEINVSEKIFYSPNPFSNSLLIKATKPQGQIILFDITGKQILKQKAFDVETIINTQKLFPGFYLLKYTEGDKASNFKVVKE